MQGIQTPLSLVSKLAVALESSCIDAGSHCRQGAWASFSLPLSLQAAFS